MFSLVWHRCNLRYNINFALIFHLIQVVPTRFSDTKYIVLVIIIKDSVTCWLSVLLTHTKKMDIFKVID